MLKLIALSGVALVLLTGCQSVHHVEFYEPTEANRAYSVESADGSPGHGPLKSVEGKSGSPDFSDHKSFSFRVSVL